MAAARKRFLSDSERRVVQGFQTLADGNPFLEERVEAERAILGSHFRASGAVWHAIAKSEHDNPNLEALVEVVEPLARTLRERLVAGVEASAEDLRGYEAVVRYLCFSHNEDEFLRLIQEEQAGGGSTRPVPAFDRFEEELASYVRLPGVRFPFDLDPGHLFAWGYQIRRAFEHTYRHIFGASMPVARLRADVWRSVFSADVDLYRRVLYGGMDDFSSLIVGASGTGKELVARAIGLSRYIPFDAERRCFATDSLESFQAVNISARASTLLESELFGHKRGSFTGAVEDRVGWFESCKPLGTVFLDEIGELDVSIQVKLLRVLQERRFQRVGETADRRFEGKFIAATNRDLELEMQEGRFRRDLYYRLCADIIRTPTLAEQIQDAPDQLFDLVLILATRIVGEEDAEPLARRVVDFVAQGLGLDYAWPGNVRELEQCVRNILIRGDYCPRAPTSTRDRFGDDDVLRGELTAEEVLRFYCTRVYHEAGSYEEAARRLDLDRRTVKARVDPVLLERLRGAGLK
jgi:MoxR-like ATPase